MLRTMKDLPPDAVRVILSFLQNYEFSRVNSVFKNQNIYVIVKVSVGVFEDLKNLGLNRIFEKFLQNHKIAKKDKTKAEIFNRVFKHLCSILKLANEETFSEIKFKYEKGQGYLI